MSSSTSLITDSFRLVPPLSFSVLVLGDAQRINVFDPVDVLWLRSAGWCCMLDAARRDAGQESAGVQSLQGSHSADDHHNQPLNILLGPRVVQAEGITSIEAYDIFSAASCLFKDNLITGRK